MSRKRTVVGKTGDGRLVPFEQDVPEMRPGAVRVAVKASLVSPGTELGGWRSFAAARAQGKEPGEPRPFGYSNAGVVAEVAPGAEEFSAGDRVACIGGGYALHATEAVVPHNLCVKMPDDVTFAQGSYAMLAATAMHALRRGEPQLGEYAAVVGMGVLGQLSAQLYQLGGCYVIGWDLIPKRLDVATRWGIAGVCNPGEQDAVETTKAFTNQVGLDAAVIALGGGDATPVIQLVGRSMKKSPDGHAMGYIVVVGNPTFEYRAHESAGMTNVDIRRASRTSAGYHDEAWEFGPAYPPVFMRWTTRTNLELCMRLISEGRLNVDGLTTHTIPLADVEKRIDEAINTPDDILGVVFEM